jgi:hypothetical protein
MTDRIPQKTNLHLVLYCVPFKKLPPKPHPK